ncbi:bifunctional UDP-N-acetylglucosamine diphosphorylase/glucosamine-1-phosphate N-acetyltransferase GlmU [Devosia neptuniae]|jgi:bifunctional UDP-N-acetylglucosamine pyrophosphorylase/glucosamine-1-phosphate N-acetyltransferase|uniref:bifunctional UDP-N-acetylglucosamine diphosphorylase/glucosamine-1-phosphate N-acetyltransferase GlmU n=1 Tax=Devosia TaxID=46913 RepID=UPI0022AF4497|nr:bifunctional UDP-N-acetylglucosamine diphosphorylase/glucosamine-1-phosphate N-acetyltransferase GlmU [Devosia neptuniae]MCZ4346360.1 bifunctional UDP-N-acetylglucosamine diphosphorylase/glucosamine-1-phosphate N-acetyltransferase GlmU [Devosia neptuniae]|tara:strand:+ start:23795 stop:25150 length:1356 start_codon:yes stop_codon:yes gene_type:complete
MTELLSIILAAGEGTRMRSSTPKVLHQVGGLPMIGHVLRAAQSAGASSIALVVGASSERVRASAMAAAPDALVSEQHERLGTGHAVRQAQAAYATAKGNVIVLYADNPLVSPKTLAEIAKRLDDGADIVVVAYRPADPTNLGRLLTLDGRLVAIREHKDASEDERKIDLCNSGIMGFKADALRGVIDRIGNANAKGEYYLTDAVELANADGRRVEYVEADPAEVVGVDDRSKLAQAEATFQELRRADFMAAGVTLHDPKSVWFSYDTEIAQDVTIEPNVVFGPGVKIDTGAVIHAFSHLEGAHVGANASVGPFARLRPGANLGEGAKIGNFVEVKKADIGKGAKVSHLSYIGDASIGSDVNIGAGVITVNYDGYNKHQTVIGNNAFIGSNTSLIAPVNVGPGALVGSGSVITDDVEADALALARGRQVNKPGRAKDIFAAAKAEKFNKKGL